MTRRVAITGAAGQLGRELVQVFGQAGDDVLALHRPEFEITRGADLERLAAWQPQIVINAAAWTDVDGCARDPERARRINGDAAGAVAAAAGRAGALAVQISTNEVFDGGASSPYREDARPAPCNAYGASKLLGEQAVAEAAPSHLIVRTAWLFGPGGTNFVTKILAAAQRAADAGEPLRVVDDEWGNPTWTPTLAAAIREAASGRATTPILHLAGVPATTRHAWAERVLAALGASAPALERISSAEFQRASAAPPRAILDTSLAVSLGLAPLDWELASDRYAVSLTTAGSPA